MYLNSSASFNPGPHKVAIDSLPDVEDVSDDFGCPYDFSEVFEFEPSGPGSYAYFEGPDAKLATSMIAKGLDFPTALAAIKEASQKQSAATATSVEQPATKGPFEPTDAGNAERFAAQHGENVRYCYAWKSWLVWDGCRWKVDDSGEVERLAKKTARSILVEASELANKHELEEMVRWAMASQSRSHLTAMIALAQSEQPIPIAVDSLDAEPWLLNVENGTLDLRTGELREHRRDDFLTKLCPLEYPIDASVEPVQWLEFLNTIFIEDVELIGFVQRLLGMSLVGEVYENILPIFYGSGSNGKSVLSEAWCGVLGPDFAMSAPDGYLIASKSAKHSTEIADLFGKRVVSVNETADGGQLSESVVKRLTSRERIRARHVCKDNFEFKPSHTIILATNYKPEIKGTDIGIWRRMRLIPFDVTIPDDKQDKKLGDKLKAEYPAILKWAVIGLLEWLANGMDLKAPEAVMTATAEYRAEQDLLGSFLEEYCIVGNTCEEQIGLLFAQWEKFCESQGEKQPTQKDFAGKLKHKNFTKYKCTESGPNRLKVMYKGLRLNPAAVQGVASNDDDDNDWANDPLPF